MSLQFLLSTRGLEVTQFSSAVDFLEAISGLAPAPIISDVRMPRLDGLQLMSELVQRDINWPVIFLTGHGEIGVAVKALKLGATDFLEKPVAATDLDACLKRAFVNMEQVQSIASDKKSAQQQWALLSTREREVLTELCRGSSNKQVAFKLSISPRTVEMHRANALRILVVRSISEVLTIKVRAEHNLKSN